MNLRGKIWFAAAVALVATPVSADERASSKYEDDAWYDVSEWFDGNDYNPTDEAIGRFDSERFSYIDNATSSDRDNDDEADRGEYDDGYSSYVDADRDSYYEKHSRYYDADNDNVPDVYAEFSDDDADGRYENVRKTDLSGRKYDSTEVDRQIADVQKNVSSRGQTVQGKVVETGMAADRTEVRLIATVRSSDGDVKVDMGEQGITFQLFEGDTVVATGPMIKRDGEQVLLANEVETKGTRREIKRGGRTYTGTVTDVATRQVAGKPHRRVKMKTDQGKMITIDMGEASSGPRLSKGQSYTVTGVPVRVADRVILLRR